MLMAPPWWAQMSLGDMMQECQPGAPCALGGLGGLPHPSWLSGFCRADSIEPTGTLSRLPALCSLSGSWERTERVCRAPQYSRPCLEGGPPLHRLLRLAQALGLPLF